MRFSKESIAGRMSMITPRKSIRFPSKPSERKIQRGDSLRKAENELKK